MPSVQFACRAPELRLFIIIVMISAHKAYSISILLINAPMERLLPQELQLFPTPQGPSMHACCNWLQVLVKELRIPVTQSITSILLISFPMA